MPNEFSISREDVYSSTFFILAKNRDNDYVKGIGTAFCVASFDKAALLFTAGHNIEQIQKLEKRTHQLGMPEIFIEKPKSTDKYQIFILLIENGVVHECELINFTSWNTYDVASMWVKLPSIGCAKIKWSVNTQIPKSGTNVGLIGFDEIEYKNNQLKLGNKILSGKVLGVVKGENALSKSTDCIAIKTNIPLNSGFSGAPLIDLDSGFVVGIASRDSGNSSSSSKGIGCYSLSIAIIHVFGITIPNSFISIPELDQLSKCKNKDFKTLFHLVACGCVTDKSNCHEKVELKNIKKNGLAADFKWVSN